MGDALHAFFQCGEVQEELGERWGWEGLPGGATDVGQLYGGDLKRAVAYAADAEELLHSSPRLLGVPATPPPTFPVFPPSLVLLLEPVDVAELFAAPVTLSKIFTRFSRTPLSHTG